MRSVGHYAGKLRRAAADFQRQFDEAMRESEVEEVRKAIESVRTETPGLDLKAPIDQPVMLPKPAAAPGNATPTPTPKPKPKPRTKPAAKPRKPAKPKPKAKAKAPAKRKAKAERAP
jgi:sec-independent protein translocase protein TatB